MMCLEDQFSLHSSLNSGSISVLVGFGEIRSVIGISTFGGAKPQSGSREVHPALTPELECSHNLRRWVVQYQWQRKRVTMLSTVKLKSE